MSEILFKCIAEFVDASDTLCEGKNEPLHYLKMIVDSKTLRPEQQQKISSIFKDFCVLNEQFIINKKISDFKSTRIIYTETKSDKCYLDIKEVYEKATEKSCIDTVWEYLNVLLVLSTKKIDESKLVEKNQEFLDICNSSKDDDPTSLVMKLMNSNISNSSPESMEVTFLALIASMRQERLKDKFIPGKYVWVNE